MDDVIDGLNKAYDVLIDHGLGKNARAVMAAKAEIARLRAALVKIRDDHYPPSDLEIRDCEQPEMIWQSVARRALAPVLGRDA